LELIGPMLDVTTSDERPVLAVTGLAREARIAAGPGVITICSGGDPRRLRTLLEAVDGRALRAVISFGLAGGLDPALRPGDLVVATEVAATGRRWKSHPGLVESLAASLEKYPDAPTLGRLAGVEAVVLDAVTKAKLRDATGAAAVDMESHVTAEFAAVHQLPIVALRAICDPASRALPPLAQHTLKPNGKVNLAAVFGGLAGDPIQMVALMRAARDSAAAFGSLRRGRRLLGAGFGFLDRRELAFDMA
jgi:hopanoid-associated phosphorylase